MATPAYTLPANFEGMRADWLARLTNEWQDVDFLFTDSDVLIALYSLEAQDLVERNREHPGKYRLVQQA